MDPATVDFVSIDFNKILDLHDDMLSNSDFFKIKQKGYIYINSQYYRTFARHIDKVLVYQDTTDVVFPKDKCVHYIINQISEVLSIIQLASVTVFKNVTFVFVPYLKQLKITAELFQNDACCQALVIKLINECNQLIEDCHKQYNDTVCKLQNRIDLTNILLDKAKYCNLCNEHSNLPKFLKTGKTCCSYSICNMCYSTLLERSIIDKKPAMCPACRKIYKIGDTDDCEIENVPLGGLIFTDNLYRT
jgi:hypothetical protein